jgi:uncharacterized membrane protein
VDKSKENIIGLTLLTLAYPLTHFLFAHIPNPIVPSANLALNMIFPVLAGYFYGPISGAVAGAIGTGLSALIGPDMFDMVSILPHAVMGCAAGAIGGTRSQFKAALTIIIGHLLNIFFYWRVDLITTDRFGTLFLGLITETTIDLVAIILLIVLLQKKLYNDSQQRW